MRIHRTDCLVIGAGLAGSAYALRAAKRGLAVELLSLAGPLAANSDWAQGGIIYDTSPDPEALTRDILEAGDNMSNPAAVEQLVREGPGIVKQVLIDELGVGFDRDAKGQLDFTLEGATGRGGSSIPAMRRATPYSPLLRSGLTRSRRSPGAPAGWPSTCSLFPTTRRNRPTNTAR